VAQASRLCAFYRRARGSPHELFIIDRWAPGPWESDVKSSCGGARCAPTRL